MKIAQTVAQILNSDVTLEVECIDRMYLNLYVPGTAARERSGWLSPESP
jgi:hypothetical protein